MIIILLEFEKKTSWNIIWIYKIEYSIPRVCRLASSAIVVKDKWAALTKWMQMYMSLRLITLILVRTEAIPLQYRFIDSALGTQQIQKNFSALVLSLNNTEISGHGCCSISTRVTWASCPYIVVQWWCFLITRAENRILYERAAV